MARNPESLELLLQASTMPKKTKLCVCEFILRAIISHHCWLVLLIATLRTSLSDRLVSYVKFFSAANVWWFRWSNWDYPRNQAHQDLDARSLEPDRSQRVGFHIAEGLSCKGIILSIKISTTLTKKSVYWVNSYDVYHSYDNFRADYINKFGHQPYVSPWHKARWYNVLGKCIDSFTNRLLQGYWRKDHQRAVSARCTWNCRIQSLGQNPPHAGRPRCLP